MYRVWCQRLDNRKLYVYICITVFIFILLYRQIRHQKLTSMANDNAAGPSYDVEFDIGIPRVVHSTAIVDDLANLKTSIYTQVEHTKLFIYAAIARNMSTPWDEFGVTAWIHSGVEPNASCCFLHSDGVVRTMNVWKYSTFLKPEIYVIRFQCANPIPGSKPIGMTLAVSGLVCSPNITTYVKPLYPLRPHGNVTIALCTKQAYGNLNPSLVVEWLEYNRNMGVDKVITFVDANNLIQNTSQILRYYEKRGFVDIIPYDIPMRDTIPRIPGSKTGLTYSDNLAAIHYCEDILAGYSFVAVADFDEFIFPRKHADIKQLMVYLSKVYSDAGAFTFNSEIYITSWGKMNENSELIITQYSNRTEAMMDRVKNMLIPQRIEPGAVSTHTARTNSGYRGHFNQAVYQLVVRNENMATDDESLIKQQNQDIKYYLMRPTRVLAAVGETSYNLLFPERTKETSESSHTVKPRYDGDCFAEYANSKESTAMICIDSTHIMATEG